MSLLVFPELPSMEWNSNKRMRHFTKVQKSGSGKRKAMTNRAYPEWEIECSYKALDPDDIEKAAGFAGQVRGQLMPFLWLDPEDYRQAGVVFGTGNGSTKQFQLLRKWGDYYEPIRDIVPGSLIVYQNSDRTTVTLGDDGIVTFATAPALGAVLVADYYYYWRVAFADDDLDWSVFWYDFFKLNKIKLVTVT